MNWQPVINFSADASGARLAGLLQQVVVIVDLIDMSTTLEAALEGGACAVYGASPDGARAPVPVDPLALGKQAGQEAQARQAPVIIVAEPRWGSDRERLASCRSVIAGLKAAGIEEYRLVPNLGISTAKLTSFEQAVVIAVTNAGGVAFDAAWTAGGTVLTATVARTWHKKGEEPAVAGVKRALAAAMALQKDLCFVAASSKAQEDLLAAQYLTRLALYHRERASV